MERVCVVPSQPLLLSESSPASLSATLSLPLQRPPEGSEPAVITADSSPRCALEAAVETSHDTRYCQGQKQGLWVRPGESTSGLFRFFPLLNKAAEATGGPWRIWR